MAPRPRTAAFTLLVVASLLVVTIVVSKFATTNRPDTRRPAMLQPVASVRPEARDSTYVGSQACAECHKEIFDQFKASPMGQSMASVAEAVTIEDYEQSLVKPTPYRHYQVSRNDDTVIHQELLLDDTGKSFADQASAVSFVVGSGRRGRGYLIHDDGLLYQSPLAWYGHKQRWDLAPGYAPEAHPRFSRRIGDGCLYCHAGRTAPQPLASDRYEAPIFEELAIGCERCHGPGQRHVDFHMARDGAIADDLIVNRADLPVSKRESVCNQCHLLGRSVMPRYGRGFFDFRPGDDLSDIFVVLSHEVDAELHGTLKAVNQVEQMRSSRCYVASDAQLGCTSCHDPHSAPQAEQRVDYYRQRCLSCHGDAGCALDLAHRNEPPAKNSCIHCHMPRFATSDVPHTSLTDHRILRDPTHGTLDAERGPSPRTLVILNDAGGQIPRREAERARGITLMTEAWNKRDEHLAATALSHLLEAAGGGIPDTLPAIDDVPLLAELGSAYLLLGSLDLADACWNRLLEVSPNHETGLMGLAKLAEERQDVELLSGYLDKLERLKPNSEEVFSLRVKQQHFARNAAGAIQAAERALAINPASIELREWLVAAYRERDEADKAEWHQAFLDKLKSAKAKATSTNES